MNRLLPLALILSLGCLLGAGSLSAAEPSQLRQAGSAPAKHGKHHKHVAHHKHHHKHAH
jgi:hypothetical protein